MTAHKTYRIFFRLWSIVIILAMLLVPRPLAAEGQSGDGAVKFRLTNPQTLAISDDGSPVTASIDVPFSGSGGSEVVSIEWIVISNGGFDISFLAASQDDPNNPRFSKDDVDAPGQNVYLETIFGVVISGAGISTENNTYWGGPDENAAATAPTGTGANLVKVYNAATAAPDSPDESIGVIIPGDTTGTATVTLYAKGIFTGETQPGSYTLAVSIRAWPCGQE